MELKEIRMYGRNRWYVVSVLLALLLTMGSLSGCGTGTDNREGENISAKGRYVEKSIELPVREDEEVLNLAKSENGNPVLYTFLAGEQVSRYEYEDGGWEKAALEWVVSLPGWQEIYIQEVQEQADGTQVVWGVDEELCTHVARSRDGKTGEELTIPYLTEQGEFGYPAIIGIQIDGDGYYWLNNLYQSEIAVIDPDSMDLVQKIHTAQSMDRGHRMMFEAENGDLAVNTGEGSFTLYGPGGEEKETFQTDQKEPARMCNAGKNWYLVSEEGIIRTVQGNETSEVLFDGSMGEMGSSLNEAEGIITGKQDDFYVLYRQEKTGTCSLVHYVYDKDAAAVPVQTLRVFGLAENPTIQDAILAFQKIHPEVKVEFQTAGRKRESLWMISGR